MKIKLEWLVEFRAMKEICARNGLFLNEEIYKRAVKPFLREHNWPPGNSQVSMTKFVDSQLVKKRKCEHPRCKRDAAFLDFPKPPGKPKVYSCRYHHDKALENQLLKNYKPL